MICLSWLALGALIFLLLLGILILLVLGFPLWRRFREGPSERVLLGNREVWLTQEAYAYYLGSDENQQQRVRTIIDKLDREVFGLALMLKMLR